MRFEHPAGRVLPVLVFIVLILVSAVLFSCRGNEKKKEGYVHYSVDIDAMPHSGTIRGQRSQTPDSDGMYTAVTALPALGYRFAGWSDGVVEANRHDSVETADGEIYAVFEYDVLDVPVVIIGTSTKADVTSKEEFISGSVTIYDTDGSFVFSDENMQIRGRGNSTWNMEKKSYRIKLSSKGNPLGVGKADARSWVLLANHCDHSLQRVETAFGIADMLGGLEFVPGTRQVEVFLNGEYRGIYLLSEQVQPGSGRVPIDEKAAQKSEDPDFLVEKTAWDYEYGFTVRGDRYGIKSDLSTESELRDRQIERIDEVLTAAYDALKTGDRSTVMSVIDINSLVDDYILQEVTKNFDVGFDSFYIYRKNGIIFFGPPWDFDLSLGNADLGFERSEGLTAALCPTNPVFDTSNPWFYMAMEHAWFRYTVKNRWNEVKVALLTVPELIRERGEIYAGSFDRNFAKWKIFGINMARTTESLLELGDSASHCEYLASWLEERLEWLDGIFNSKEFAKGDLG